MSASLIKTSMLLACKCILTGVVMLIVCALIVVALGFHSLFTLPTKVITWLAR